MYLLDTHAIIWYVRGTLDFEINISRLKTVLENEEFIYLRPTEYDLERIKKLPDIHRDPFDRLLIAQAIENNLTIITRDLKIPSYQVKTIW
ncbi:MAG: type II toxin-antitoxin system VapC family toxin [Treponema sp.]